MFKSANNEVTNYFPSFNKAELAAAKRDRALRLWVAAKRREREAALKAGQPLTYVRSKLNTPIDDIAVKSALVRYFDSPFTDLVKKPKQTLTDLKEYTKQLPELIKTFPEFANDVRSFVNWLHRDLANIGSRDVVDYYKKIPDALTFFAKNNIVLEPTPIGDALLGFRKDPALLDFQKPFKPIDMRSFGEGPLATYFKNRYLGSYFVRPFSTLASLYVNPEGFKQGLVDRLRYSANSGYLPERSTYAPYVENF